MYGLTFKNVGEIRMGSPFNMAEVALTGRYVPDLSHFTFQDIGLVDPIGDSVYLIQWEIEHNQPGFRVWKISAMEKSVRKTGKLEGCCKKIIVAENKLNLEVFRNGKEITVCIQPS